MFVSVCHTAGRFATSLEQGRDGRPAVVGYAVPHYGVHNSTILYPTIIPLFKAVAFVTMLSVYNFFYNTAPFKNQGEPKEMKR